MYVLRVWNIHDVCTPWVEYTLYFSHTEYIHSVLFPLSLGSLFFVFSDHGVFTALRATEVRGNRHGAFESAARHSRLQVTSGAGSGGSLSRSRDLQECRNCKNECIHQKCFCKRCCIYMLFGQTIYVGLFFKYSNLRPIFTVMAAKTINIHLAQWLTICNDSQGDC
ncbi:hypothetical protein FKM82_028287 [Ascaphus truei]